MAELFEKCAIKICIVVCIIGLGIIVFNEGGKIVKCNSLHGVMIDGKCLALKELK
jgi:hypothetical protein